MNRIIALVAVILMLASIMAACTKDSGEKYVSAEGVEYSYCLELSGTMPNTAKPSTWVVYTNDPELTFEKASKSIYSSDFNDYVDMYIVSMD